MITAIAMLAGMYTAATAALALGIYEVAAWRRENQRRAAAQLLAVMTYVAYTAARSAAPHREIVATAPAQVQAAAPVQAAAEVAAEPDAPAEQVAAETVAAAEPAAPVQHEQVSSLPVSGTVTRPFKGFTYSFTADSITVAGLRYPVEYSVSRPQMSRIPTVTALYWTDAGRVALRIEGGDHLHAAALAAAKAAAAA